MSAVRGEATEGGGPAGGPLDRRALGVLGFGHLSADFCQGALPALLPFLAAQRGWSYGALGALMLAASVGSSAIQPLFGLATDRLGRPWLMPVGVLVAGLGIAAVGLSSSYAVTAAAVALGGVGVAAFHPEAARFANLASGATPGRGMSLFSVGGNAGFALGPGLATALVVAFGLPGTLGLAVLPAAAALVLALAAPRLGTREAAARRAGARRRGPERRGAFAVLTGVVALRSALYFGLQTLGPAYFVVVLGTSDIAAGSALTAMLAAGALGTLTGGLLADRIGTRRVLVVSLAALIPLVAALPLAGAVAAFPLMAGIGFVAVASFSVTVLLGQEYLPDRMGLASGVTIGLAIGLGGIAAGGLGWLADATSLTTVMWVLAAVPVPTLLLALALPRTPSLRPARSR